MKNYFICLFLFMGLGSTAFGEGSQSKIHFPESAHHFGDVVQGSKAECKFVFQNTGTAQLKIDKVETSCGCTAAVAGKKELEPQESSEIAVSFNSAGRQGQFQKVISVYSNDPLTPKAQLNIDGQIITVVDVQPTMVNFGEVRFGEASERDVQIRLGSYKKPLRISEIEKTANIEAEIKDPVIQPGMVTTLKIRVKPTTITRMSEKVALHFEDPAINPINISVFAQILGPIQVIPDRLNIVARADNPQQQIQKIQFIAKGVTPFKIVKVELDPEVFDYQITTIEDGKKYEITLQLKGELKERFFARTMKVTTTDESMKEIEVFIQVWIPTPTSKP